MNLFVPFGFYGAGNVGDEATLQGFARLVAYYHKGVRVWVGSRDPSHTARVEPSFRYHRAEGPDMRRWLTRNFSGGQVVAGGTPIMDVLGDWPLSELAPLVSDAHLKRKPMVFVGIGTEHLQRDESRVTMAKVIAPNVLHWSVRCARDRERLVEYGVAEGRVTVAADMAWLLERASTTFGKAYLKKLNFESGAVLIGVNVNNEKFVMEQEPELFEKLASFLDVIIEKYGARILFFCNEVRETETYDKAASEKVVAHIKNKDKVFIMPNHYWSPQEMLSFIGCCHMVIGMRYHSCLFSALQNVPFIALKRSGKVEDLCWDMDWPHGVSLGEISVDGLSDIYDSIEQNWDQLVQSLLDKVRLMRERALINTIPLVVLFERLFQ